jgi:hypothetical protein
MSNNRIIDIKILKKGDFRNGTATDFSQKAEGN